MQLNSYSLMKLIHGTKVHKNICNNKWLLVKDFVMDR